MGADSTQRVSTAQAARALGVSVRRVQAMITRGRLPARRQGGRWTIKVSDLADPGVNYRRTGRPRKGATL